MKNKIIDKRIKWLLKIYFIFFFVTFLVGSVSASEISTLSYEKIDNIYSYVKRPDETRLFYLKIYQFNGKPAYCIELGKDIVDNNYFSTTDYSKMGYSIEQIDYINLISYYGYEYPGHSDYRYYMAAQELIWEYLEGIDIYWTNELNKNNPSKINIDKYLNEVKSLVQRHYLKPSFNDVYEYCVGDEIEITDSNNRLSNYEIVTEDGIEAVIKDNKIIITNNGDKVGKYNIKLRQRVVSSNSGLIYYNNTSQTLYSMRGIEPNEIDFDIVIKGASFVLNKYDSNNLTNTPLYDGSLSGAEYGFYDSNDELVSVLVTDDNGRASIDGLIFGNYTLKEIKPSYGYRLDENVYSINIDKRINDLVVYEDYDLKLIEIYKTYGDSYIIEENVGFDIISEDGTVFSTIYTDEEGYASVWVPYGRYTIRQNNSIDGYMKVSDISVIVNNESEDIITYKLNDEKIIEILNPKTYDGIHKHIIFLVMSMLGLFIIILYLLVNKYGVKIIKRGMVLLGVFLIIFVRNDTVLAASKNKMFYHALENHYIIGVFDDDRFLSHARIYNFSDKPVYLLLFSSYFPNDGMYYYTEDYESLGYSIEDIEYIQLIGYYGYEYFEHINDYHYYMAAQELILEYLTGAEIYFSDQFTLYGRELDITSYKNEILDLVSKHSVLPSFSGGEYVFSVASDNIEIIDTNSVLSNYYISDSDGLDVSISDNKLIIGDDVNIGEYNIRLKRKNYIEDNSYVFYNDGYTSFYSVGGFDFEEVGVDINISGVSLKLKEYSDLDFSLSNSIYELYDSNNILVSTIYTDENGEAIVNGLSLGIYNLKEIVSSYDGYRLDENVYSINILEEENSFDIYKEGILDKFEIYIMNDYNNVFSGDDIFDIYDIDGNLITTLSIDNDGYGSVMLPYGKYIISQRKEVHGFVRFKDFEVEIDDDNLDVITYKLNVYENRIMNPKTYDGISLNIIFLIVSSSLIGICIYVLIKSCYNWRREDDYYEYEFER